MFSPSNNKNTCEQTKEEMRLLEGVFSKDRKVMREFFNIYTPYIHAIARKIQSRDPALDFDDLVNEGFLHLFENDNRRLREFEFKAGLKTYIYIVVRRHLLGKLRGKGLGHRVDTSEPESLEQIASQMNVNLDWSGLADSSPEKNKIHIESSKARKQLFQLATEKLKAKELLQVKYCCDGYTTEELMDILGFKDRAQLDKAKFNLVKKMQREIRRLSVETKYA
ncbi:MAG: sigma-70 family RNA polymerase sigma factor [Fibrobacteria bacterium]|nr:sigma-70 family RNA polymerase sigma factor [Fibrobacteria bacterium]